jgi:zinc/manganese transport system substrate-binding protein
MSAACIVTATLLATACGAVGEPAQSTDTGSGGGLAIVATTTVLGDATRNVAPADSTATVLMDAGADPHTFEPSARQLAAMLEADLIVANGGGLEEGLRTALADAEAAGVPVFSALDHVTPLDAGGGADDSEAAPEDDHREQATHEGDAQAEQSEETSTGHSEEATTDHGEEATTDHSEQTTAAHGEDGHDHGAVDPHFWMDPIRMAEAVEGLASEIGRLTGAPRRSADRADRYVARLRELDDSIRDMFDDIPDARRAIVTNHEALAYFADRYGLRTLGTVIPSVTTGAEPSARDIERLALLLRREGVTTIFVDSTAPQRVAQTVASEVGPDTQIVELYTGSIGGDGEGPGSYVDMLTVDAERISGALR